MELEKKQIHCLRIGKKITDQFYLDEDYNVPDVKDDVRKIVHGKAEIRIEDLKPVENYLRVMGKLQFHILYVPARMEPQLSVLEGSFPFEEMVYTEGETGDQFFVRNTRVEFTSNLVHSRKISVRAMIELEIDREDLQDEEITLNVEDGGQILCKHKKINLLQMNMTKKDTYRIKEEITLPGTKEGIGQILQSDISDRKLDLRLGQDELLIRGELMVFCLYLSEDLKTDWIEQTVPYEGRVECYGAEEGMYYQIHTSLEDSLLDVRMDEDGEMRVLGIEGTLSLRINIFEESEMEMLEDAYTVDRKCELKTREANYEELLIQNQSKCKMTEQLSLPELKEDVLQICHSEGSLQVEQTKIMADGIYIEGILHLSFLYIKADDEMPFATWQGMVPFSHLLECPDICEDARYHISPHLEQLQISLLGSQNVEVKAVLSFDTFVRRPIQMQMITDLSFSPVTEEEMEKMPGIVGYIVKDGDTLWNLARHYMTTMDAIREINHLENNQLKAGERMLIMRESVMPERAEESGEKR